jgi:hypothetical protein
MQTYSLCANIQVTNMYNQLSANRKASVDEFTQVS